jgi:hypothetical protein
MVLLEATGTGVPSEDCGFHEISVTSSSAPPLTQGSANAFLYSIIEKTEKKTKKNSKTARIPSIKYP